MRQLIGQPLLGTGEARYFWEDALLASVLRGDWSDLERLVREELSCVRRSRHLDDAASSSAVDAAAAEFRYDRNLVSAADTYGWLERWGLDAAEWMAWVRRSVARARLSAPQRDDAAAALAPTAGEVVAALPVTLVCSGAAERFARRLAERAAALSAVGADESRVDAVLERFPDDLEARGFGELGEARLRARMRIVARLEVALADFRAVALTPRALSHEVGGRHLDWIRVDYCCVHFATESMAREAVLCVRDDGLELDAVAAEAGAGLRRERSWLGDVDRELRERLLAARAGELLGPVQENGGYLVRRIEAKRLPTLDDPEVRGRAEESALRGALAAAVNDRVQWEVAL